MIRFVWGHFPSPAVDNTIAAVATVSKVLQWEGLSVWGLVGTCDWAQLPAQKCSPLSWLSDGLVTSVW